jgi:GNAT superfamily N-acetyltransferase
MKIEVRQAESEDAAVVLSILTEAAEWLRGRGIPLWHETELVPKDIWRHAGEGRYFVALCDGEAAGVFRFELTDPEFWPDATEDDSGFVHRLAVRRGYAGGRVSAAMLDWAARRVREFGRRYLRLDCDAARPRLRAIYEEYGFLHHSDRFVGDFFVARYQMEVGRAEDG